MKMGSICLEELPLAPAKLWRHAQQTYCDSRCAKYLQLPDVSTVSPCIHFADTVTDCYAQLLRHVSMRIWHHKEQVAIFRPHVICTPAASQQCRAPKIQTVQKLLISRL